MLQVAGDDAIVVVLHVIVVTVGSAPELIPGRRGGMRCATRAPGDLSAASRREGPPDDLLDVQVRAAGALGTARIAVAVTQRTDQEAGRRDAPFWMVGSRAGYIWDSRGLTVLGYGSDITWSAAFAADQALLGRSNGTVEVRDLARGELTSTLQAGEGRVWSLAAGSDATRTPFGQISRRRLRRLLAFEPDCDVAGECVNGRDAIESLERENVDILFLDVQMPE
ncbi:MAG: hypothetical protein ACLP7J_04800, partial [Streptosporangiaceae bacterium]